MERSVRTFSDRRTCATLSGPAMPLADTLGDLGELRDRFLELGVEPVLGVPVQPRLACRPSRRRVRAAIPSSAVSSDAHAGAETRK